MVETVPVLKDEKDQRPIPSDWRPTLGGIVDAFRDGDYRLSRDLNRVSPISNEDAEIISRSIDCYGATLVSLPDLISVEPQYGFAAGETARVDTWAVPTPSE